jgi:hypothetical protein
LRNTDQGQEGVLSPGYTEIPSSDFPPVIAHVTGLISPAATGVTGGRPMRHVLSLIASPVSVCTLLRRNNSFSHHHLRGLHVCMH